MTQRESGASVRPARGRLLRLGACASVAATVGVGTVAGLAQTAGAATRPAAGGARDVLTASSTSSCPTTQNADIAFSGTLSNGTASFGSAASASGITGTVCGLLDLENLTATIQPQNLSFQPTSVTLFGLLPAPATLSATGPATATLQTVGAGEFNATMTVPLEATVNLLGLFRCTVGPFEPTFTTGTSGSVSGTPLTGDLLQKLSGTLAAGEFPVPRIQSSMSCPWFISGLSNLLLGLPLPAGRSTVTTQVSLTPDLGSAS
ncbi:hypothetical protein ACFFRE_12995 [Aciditerrimonas ferrireducens]|uniref:Secreted protein n=1 Tax=Aciditerrimonas ferrireducens TaxID=667306 RepID=A0ABV6C5S8_9ACTN|nr:hypothetical protein [Aciditerrimonas ferrireducens]MCK4176854.1 hypothetical protein [Aciditerrimonas ferrireducens]